MNLDFKNRKEVPERYKIDLSKLYQDNQAWQKDFEYLKKHINDLTKYQNHILDNAANLYEVLSIDDNLNIILEKLYIYANVNKDCDLLNQEYDQMVKKLMNIFSQYSALTSFVVPELLKSDYSLVEKYLKEDKRLEQYRFTLEQLYRYQNHTLSDKEEAIIASLSNCINYDAISEVLNNAEINYGSVKIDGVNKEITSSNGLDFATHKNRRVRKTASVKKMRKLQEFGNTFATCLTTNLKAYDTIAKLKHYDNFQQEALYGDNVSFKLYDSVIDHTVSNLKTYQKWYRLLRKFLGLKTLYNYDVNVPLIKEYDKKYSAQEAEELVTNALAIMGKEYQEIVKKGFKERWVDYYTYKGKKFGGYSTYAYNCMPVVFLNYKGYINDISTLAHEMGHAVHFYLSGKNNAYNMSEPRIFVCEVASLTNEILFSHYLMEHSNSNQEKLSSLYNLIETISDNFYGAAMQADFERVINTKISEDIMPSKDEINEIWSNLNKKYYAPALKFLPESSINWARIPHFYGPFYTYKYVIGIVGACYVATNILNNTPGFKEKYLEFLKSGSNDYPVNQLKKLGIDLESDEPFTATVDLLDNLINEFTKLYEEVNHE